MSTIFAERKKGKNIIQNCCIKIKSIINKIKITKKKKKKKEEKVKKSLFI